MTWINRILMIPFCLILLVGTIYVDFLWYAALITFVLGAFQLLSALITLFYFDELKEYLKSCVLIYLSLVIVYFVCFFLLIDLFDLYNIKAIIYIIPIILSLFWTYILESLKNDI
jgi:hypothetical protein